MTTTAIRALLTGAPYGCTVSSGHRRSQTLRVCSCVFDHHAFDHVRHVFTTVGGVLDVLVDLLPLDHHHRVALLFEQARGGDAKEGVALVLEPVDLDAGGADALRIAQVV